MELKPLTKDQAMHIVELFKPLENKHTFQVPGTMDPLMVSHITIAPFKGPEQDNFKYNFQTGFDLNGLIDRYYGTNYTVLVIANIVSIGKITLTQPYFFDIYELNEKKVKGFMLPPEFLTR